jgi:iron complex transport system substrate-binding protein
LLAACCGLVAGGCGAAGGGSAVGDRAAGTTVAAGASAAVSAAPSTLPLFTPESLAGEPSPGAPLDTLEAVDVAEAEALPATVASADGREVTVTDASRILPLWGNLSEIVFSLGLGDRVVARDSSATFAEAAALPLVTRGHDVSAESVLSLRPTIVLAQTDTGPPEALDQIRNAGVPVLVLDTPKSVDDSVARITTVARALGVPQAGAALAARTSAEIDAALAAVPAGADPPRIAFLYMRGSAGVYLLGGPGSGADSMIAAAGGVDAGTWMGFDQAFTPLTSEALVTAAPDAILMTTTGLESVGGVDGLVAIPGIAQTPAGRDRRVVAVEDGLLYSFGARTPQAIAEIVRQLYPAR